MVTCQHCAVVVQVLLIDFGVREFIIGLHDRQSLQRKYQLVSFGVHRTPITQLLFLMVYISCLFSTACLQRVLLTNVSCDCCLTDCNGESGSNRFGTMFFSVCQSTMSKNVAKVLTTLLSLKDRTSINQLGLVVAVLSIVCKFSFGLRKSLKSFIFM